MKKYVKSCVNCFGSGSQKCVSCNGEGCYEATETVETGTNMAECYRCHGSGQIPYAITSFITCYTCGGRGWKCVPTYKKYYLGYNVNCSSCSGTGHMECGCADRLKEKINNRNKAIFNTIKNVLWYSLIITIICYCIGYNPFSDTQNPPKVLPVDPPKAILVSKSPEQIFTKSYDDLAVEADRKLNSIYKQIMANLPQQEKVSLQKEERLWVRDKQYLMSIDDKNSSKINYELTIARIKELEKYYLEKKN